MISLDASQLEFCRSNASNIRLLAPAGCGKTISLLYRCQEIAQRGDGRQRFLIVTFTRAATSELKERLANTAEFESLKSHTNVTTLNAYGFNRIRSQVRSPRLLSKPNDYHFAMKNQLRPAWIDNKHIEQVVNRPGNGARSLMTAIDNLKAMGFDHTRDTNLQLFLDHLDSLASQGLSFRIAEQFDLLTKIGILDSPNKQGAEGPSSSRREFYNRFFIFWRNAVQHLYKEATFTFEDQKYWTYLDLKSPDHNGNIKPPISGAARYHHVLVDEVQDINPLDLRLIKCIVERNQSTLTIVGDDDQAIFDWRGATPEYILHPDQFFDSRFTSYQLGVNYRSPSNIVELSQTLISNNLNRVAKKVRATDGADIAEIDVVPTIDINERVQMVTEIVRSTEPGKVAVIGRFRSQLIPFEIYFASDGTPFKTATDLDVFKSTAFDDLTKLLKIWHRAGRKQALSRVIKDTIEICNLIKRRPFSKKDDKNMRNYLKKRQPSRVVSAILELANYNGIALNGKTHVDLFESSAPFVTAETISEAIRAIEKGFDGLSFDREKAEFDVFYTDPPLKQLADIVEGHDWDVEDLEERIETVKEQTQEFHSFEEEDASHGLERPLHLMTAHRAKGREFDVVILLDAVKGVWPNRVKDERDMESQRRLFYVAFTRAKHKVIMLTGTDSNSDSPFISELGL